MDPGRSSPSRPLLALTPIVVTVGLIAAALATLASWQHAQRIADAEQQTQLATTAAELHEVTDATTAHLADLAVAVATARRPAATFDKLARRLLHKTPLATIGHVVHLRPGRVAAFRRHGGVPTVEVTPSGALAVGHARPVHYPAVRAAGADLGLFAPGVDVVSRLPGLRTAFIQAHDAGATRATAPLRVPEPVGHSTVLVSRVGRRGYVVGMLPFDRIAAALSARLGGRRFAVRDGIVDLAGEFERLRDPATRSVDVSGREWTLAVEHRRPAVGPTAAIAVIGLLLTLVLSLWTRLGTQRQKVAEAGRLAAEERSRRLAETSTDLLVVHNANGRLEYVSPACRDLLGHEPESLLGRRPQEFIHPDDLPHVTAALAHVQAGADTLAITLRLRRADGRWVWAEVHSRVLRDADGRAVEAHSAVRDISERMAAKTALEAVEARFRSTFEESPIGMAITDLDGRFQRVNRALGMMLGRTTGELEGQHFNTITHPEDMSLGREAMQRLLAGEGESGRMEKRYLHANGEEVWVALSITIVRDQDGAPLFFLTQMQDVTERRRYEAELRHLADHDPLTGLLNRRSFERELERHVAHVERYGARGAAIVLDVDHFKTINDTHGHGVGDELIERVAHALQTRLRASDALARLGGDEFAVLLPDGGREEAIAVAEDVLKVVRGQAVPATSGHARHVTASLGIALFAQGRGLTPDAILVEADLAMYEAKQAGRNRYAVADDTAIGGLVGPASGGPT